MQRLQTNRWYDHLVSPKGVRFIRLKRVSRAADAHFPKEYRRIACAAGYVALVRKVQLDFAIQGLAPAWALIKWMINGDRGVPLGAEVIAKCKSGLLQDHHEHHQ